jgi:hypothetical protein
MGRGEDSPSPDRAFGRMPVSRRAIGRGVGVRANPHPVGFADHLLPEGEGMLPPAVDVEIVDYH